MVVVGGESVVCLGVVVCDAVKVQTNKQCIRTQGECTQHVLSTNSFKASAIVFTTPSDDDVETYQSAFAHPSQPGRARRLLLPPFRFTEIVIEQLKFSRPAFTAAAEARTQQTHTYLHSRSTHASTTMDFARL